MSSLGQLKDEIAVGDKVRVINLNGDAITGKVESISDDSLMLSGKLITLPSSSIAELQKRRKDPWWNGFLIGGGIGAVAGQLAARSTCHDDSECAAIASVAFIPAGVAIGMAAGAVIDRSITKYDTVFRSSAATGRWRVSPIISQTDKGVSLAVSF